MNLREFLKSMSSKEQEDFAARCGSTLRHIKRIGWGIKGCSAEMAMCIEDESNGLVTSESLVPNARWHVVRNKSKTTLRASER